MEEKVIRQWKRGFSFILFVHFLYKCKEKEHVMSVLITDLVYYLDLRELSSFLILWDKAVNLPVDRHGDQMTSWSIMLPDNNNMKQYIVSCTTANKNYTGLQTGNILLVGKKTCCPQYWPYDCTDLMMTWSWSCERSFSLNQDLKPSPLPDDCTDGQTWWLYWPDDCTDLTFMFYGVWSFSRLQF